MKKSKIQWTDFTWNPWQGCKKVSPGCKFCYMYRDKEGRFRRPGITPDMVIKSAPSTFNKPLSIKEPKRIFTCSWSDFFIKEADAWRDEAWDIIRKTPHLTYQILTKRPERIVIPNDIFNIMVGVEAPDQIARLSLLSVKTKDVKKFVSFEPLLLPIDLLLFGFDWIIIGGESGNEKGKYRYRPCELKGIEILIKDAKYYNIPVFVKQLGTHLAKELGLKDRHGGDMSEWPERVRIRELPE